jgi:ubiquinone/menaquinone biosynthesis C-methylase UbiE
MTTNPFDKKAPDWDKKVQRQKLAKAIATALAELPLTKDMVAMDFGCGTGLVGLELAPRLGRLIAVDSSKGMIDMLSDKIAEGAITNIEPMLGEIDSLALQQEFQLIFTAMTLHHIDDVTAVLKRLRDLLLPGGLLAIADLDEEDGSFHDAESGEKHHGFNRRVLARILANLGFAPPVFHTIHTITKISTQGAPRDYPIFLAYTRRP